MHHFVLRLKDAIIVILSLISILLGLVYGWISIQLIRGFFFSAIGIVRFGPWKAPALTITGELLSVMVLIVHLGMVWLLIQGIPRTLYQWRYRDRFRALL